VENHSADDVLAFVCTFTCENCLRNLDAIRIREETHVCWSV